MTSPPVLILDNGAYNIKAGFAGVDWEPRIYPNSIARSRGDKKVYVGDEVDSCRDLSGIVYRRPFERGMLVSWDAEKIIWDRLFSSDVMNMTCPETSLLVTEPYFNLPNIAETYDQMIFEEWEFQSYFRCTPATLMPYGSLFETDSPTPQPPPACSILIDMGYSYTHVIPLRDGQIIWDHVKRRIDVGGKLLTNHLKHLISFRQWNMMDQTHVVNFVRETCSYVSMDLKADLTACKRDPRHNPIVQEYVLPDFSPNSTSRTGYIRSGPNANPPTSTDKPEMTKRANVEEEQVLWMGNERFLGPELLFHPSDIGINQSGIPETIALVIAAMPEEVRGMYWAHIGIFGGLGNIEGLGERLERDLRALCPIEYELGIFEAYDPASQPYHAAQSLIQSSTYPSLPITRAEYLETGSSICRRKLSVFSQPPYSPLSGSVPEIVDGELSDDERERRYALGLIDEEKKGKKGKKKEDEEVISGNWGGRRRRAGLGI
ncbi:hypothetical protein TREMEDRAFT_40155 [Tremella mesenterica DSM 1558]|uniref:uncharacterized protein n=1 Tax=Tremella mesenterica (strain ATCC 24925 / CBS 8224 / DSM 1558 / NBRC 9311 / NRRL Y-6157 / RJB 2259-6 / UBC 559-6) TaxID=578456 RepID=UPI0003F493E4|nr:uncharacterized protein TREMEDRAFT_40155 [Tremella mesenterica DSM 1558]EIW68065.1 hypothetical protein TREMEDRAFT_40155 [Tremella mesenterica DSM 1558]